MQTKPFRIGTRGSPLALAQAHEARDRLMAAHGLPEEMFEIVVLTTKGDRITDRSLAAIGGKPVARGRLAAKLLDIRGPRVPIRLRFAGSEQVEVRDVQHVNCLRHPDSEISGSGAGRRFPAFIGNLRSQGKSEPRQLPLKRFSQLMKNHVEGQELPR